MLCQKEYLRMLPKCHMTMWRMRHGHTSTLASFFNVPLQKLALLVKFSRINCTGMSLHKETQSWMYFTGTNARCNCKICPSQCRLNRKVKRILRKKSGCSKYSSVEFVGTLMCLKRIYTAFPIFNSTRNLAI